MEQDYAIPQRDQSESDYKAASYLLHSVSGS